MFVSTAMNIRREGPGKFVANFHAVEGMMGLKFYEKENMTLDG